MAFSKVALNSGEWTKVASGASSISFQNAGSRPIYINVTSADAAPSDSVGLMYEPYAGEMKKTVNDLTLVSGGFVWARSASGSGSIIVES